MSDSVFFGGEVQFVVGLGLLGWCLNTRCLWKAHREKAPAAGAVEDGVPAVSARSPLMQLSFWNELLKATFTVITLTAVVNLSLNLTLNLPSLLEPVESQQKSLADRIPDDLPEQIAERIDVPPAPSPWLDIPQTFWDRLASLLEPRVDPEVLVEIRDRVKGLDQRRLRTFIHSVSKAELDDRLTVDGRLDRELLLRFANTCFARAMTTGRGRCRAVDGRMVFRVATQTGMKTFAVAVEDGVLKIL